MSPDHTPMIPVSPPMVGEAGPTGTWRSQRPVLDPSACLGGRAKPRDCLICWMYCPESAINPSQPPTIDYEYCKGCGICARECPAKAISLLNEEQV